MQDGQPRRIAMVVQRYGDEVIGGAESLARSLAERFVRDLGWSVEVLTTTARDHGTWRNELPAGSSVLNGVKVRRFDSARGRMPAFRLAYAVLHAAIRIAVKLHLEGLARLLERAWFVAQGPVTPALLQHVADNAEAFDAFIFVTYLYYPTVFGLPKVAHKALLVPTAHDEPAFHFHHVADLLEQARFIMVNGPAEETLVLERTQGRVRGRVRVAGVGIDMPETVPAKEPVNPYILYLGRIGDAKNVDRLIEWFLAMPGDMRLVLAGRIDEGFALPADPRVEFAGFVDEARKATLIRNAMALVNPSRYESLSLVVLEAMALEVPVLVNAQCDTLMHYAKATTTVFAFEGASGFAAQLEAVRTHDWTTGESRERLAASRQWVRDHYAWDRITRVFADCVAQVADPPIGTGD